jgi:hypothetical protein
MNSLRFSQKLIRLLAAGIACLSFAVALNAQVETETITTHGPATKTTEVQRGEVVYVSGHDLVVKKNDGTIVHFAHVSDSARATVDGKQLGIHDLKPGMKLQRTIVTTTTPRTITTVQSVTGTVWHVSPPRSVILTLEDGKNQQFQIPDGQKIDVDGHMVDAWGLKKGMRISATRVVETPETVVSQQTKVTGTAPVTATAPVAPPVDRPIFFAMLVQPVYPTLAAATPAELPATGTMLPLVGLLGLLTLGSSLALGTIRVRA